MASTEERSLRYDAAAKRLRIATAKGVETYAVAEFRDDADGSLIGLRFSKVGGDESVSDVELADSRCDCWGYIRYGYCRHEAAMRKLLECRLIKA